MEEELKCPVCLDFFNSPVCMTPCGHNYCQQCLTGMVAIPWLCPECRTEIQQRPDQLPRNFFLERTVQNFVESRRNICGVHELPKKLHCLKHNRSLCHECKEDGLCDGQPADDCNVMKLAVFETILNDRLTKLNNQFDTINEILQAKKNAFIELYRDDPRISRDEAILLFQTTIEVFNPSNPDQKRDEMQAQLDQLNEQLARQQRQLVQQQEQLENQRETAAEAEQMRRQLADHKTRLETRCYELQQQLNKEKENNKKLLDANENLQANQQDLQVQLDEGKVARQRLESEKASADNKSNRLQQDLIQANNELGKAHQEKQDLEQRLYQLQSSLAGSERRNEELQSVLDHEARKKSNLTRELGETKQVMSNLKVENEKLSKGLKAVTSSQSEANGKIRRLEGQLQETLIRLEDAECVNTEQSEKIQKLEQDLKDARHKRKGLKTKKEPLQGAVETVQPASVLESKQTLVCESFSDYNVDVTVSSNKRSVKWNRPRICYRAFGISVNPPMEGWNGSWRTELDQSIILYNVWNGKVFGGSDPGRTVKQVQKDSDGYVPGADYTMELDLSNPSLVMEVDNEKIIIDGNIGDFDYSPIVIMSYDAPEITLL